MAPLPPGATIGIIGGGQLGRMLAMAAARLSYRVVVLEPQTDCPAAQVANSQIAAAYDDPEALAELAARCGVITYEFENVPVAAAQYLAQSCPVFPPPRALEVSQDRLTEKRFLTSIGVPAAQFAGIGSDDDLVRALGAFGGKGVLKTRRMGYDGKGQRVLDNPSAASIAGTYAAMGNVPLILEEFVPFEREISVIGVRGQDGAVVCYDPAENVHCDGILRSSAVPARGSGNTAQMAKDIAVTILERLDYAGVIGVEFFVLASGSLIVNEIAPRVHNSGHWTEAACAVSQFDNHVRAIAGLALGATDRHSNCVMENLIGGEVDRVPALAAEKDVVIHLYGKAQARPGRKMGHFTRIAPRT